MNTIITHFSLKNPEIANHYSEKRDTLILFLVMLHLGFTSLTFFICVFFSHKIAGPLYKMQKHLKLIREGNNTHKLFFRKGDYFPELADDLNETFEQLEDNYKNDLVYLSEVTSYINNLSLVVPDDKRVVLNEISSRLSSMQDRFTKI
jgi:signal transduction histidine kinase